MSPTRVHADPLCRHAGNVYELRFRSLSDDDGGCAFPCDATGHVDLDTLGERARNSYFYARTLIGRDFSNPAVQARVVH
jgi:hypothetical protein